MTAHGGDTGRLGEAISRDDLLEAEPFAHLHDHLDRNCRSAGDGESQCRHVEGVEIGVVQDRLIDRRWPGQHRHPVDGDASHHRGDVEDRVRQDRRTGHQAGEDPGVESERVEERVDDQVAVTVETDDVAPRLVPPAGGRMGEHGSLRRPRGARGEHDVAEVVAPDVFGPRDDCCCIDLPGPIHERREVRRCLRHRAAEHDDLLEFCGESGLGEQ